MTGGCSHSVSRRSPAVPILPGRLHRLQQKDEERVAGRERGDSRTARRGEPRDCRSHGHWCEPRTGSTFALAITGEAGPEPSENVPVGTVYVGLADASGRQVLHREFFGDRTRIRVFATQMALDMLRKKCTLIRGGGRRVEGGGESEKCLVNKFALWLSIEFPRIIERKRAKWCEMSSYLIARASAVLVLVLVSSLAAAPDPDRDFSGVWILDEQQSDVRALPDAPAAQLTSPSKTTSSVVPRAVGWKLFRHLGLPYCRRRSQVPNRNVPHEQHVEVGRRCLDHQHLVSGPQSFTENDRWRLSRDHNVLTIRRQILRPSGETEAVLVYRNRDAKPTAVNQPDSRGSADHPAPPDEVTVPAGTKIPLALINSLNTKGSAEGDRVYLQTSFPVVIGGTSSFRKAAMWREP